MAYVDPIEQLPAECKLLSFVIAASRALHDLVSILDRTINHVSKRNVASSE